MSTTFTASIQHVNHTTSRATVRSHSFLVDRAVARGGFDLGPAGGEYLLVSLGGCFTTHLLAAIRAREAPMTGVTVSVTGTMDGSPERFVAFTLDVTAACPDPDLAHKLITIAERGCQVVNTLRLTTSIAVTYQGEAIAPIVAAAAV